MVEIVLHRSAMAMERVKYEPRGPGQDDEIDDLKTNISYLTLVLVIILLVFFSRKNVQKL